MKNLIGIIILFVLSFSACVTQKKCNEKYPYIVLTDSVETWVEYRCDSFPVFVPYQELLFDTSGVVPQNVVFHHKQTNGSLTQTLDIKDGKIIQECHEDSLRSYIDYLSKLIHQKEKQTIQKPEGHKATWYDYACYCLSGLFILTIVGIILRK